MAAGWNDFARECAEAALHAVANDGLADLLADCEADALRLVAILAVTNEKDESRRRRAPSGVRGEEIRALLQNC